MTLTFVVYIILLLIFLVVSSLIFRHTVKYSYLSPRFKVIVGVFGLLAAGVIILSLYLLLLLSRSDSGNYFNTPPGGVNTGNGVGELNF